MGSVAVSHRAGADRCPGALRAHQAADGLLARVRLPGGLLTAAQLRVLASLPGDPRLELTSRANVQVRGLASADVPVVAERLADAGLLPSATHERVRNVVASPLAGLDAPVDLTALVAELDRSLCARPGLAELPGRFLFGVDDGRGDMASLEPDVLVVAGPSAASVCGRVVDRPVEAALDVAEAFLVERAARGSSAWRVAELEGGAAAVAARAFPAAPGAGHPGHPGGGAGPARPVGVVRQVGGGTAAVVLVPLGRLTPPQAAVLTAHAGPAGLRITPWRSIVVPDLDDPPRFLADAERSGLGVDDRSPWYRLSACTGRPGCASALADVQADAVAAAARWPGSRVHVSGCGRRCGRPADTQVDLVATGDGYALGD